MKIAIVDAEIIGKSKHRFPNLACMKISSYNKSIGNDVELIFDYNDLWKNNIYNDFIKLSEKYNKQTDKKNNLLNEIIDLSNKIKNKDFFNYDKIYLSSVFTNTVKNIPNCVMELNNIEYGGTGFFYDKAPKLQEQIEHIKPDYNLYDNWAEKCIKNGAKEKEFTYYKDYSIGFLTRGCFRQCEFCVNKNCKSCNKHSNILEFMDISRPKLCFLDDNFFACKDWREIIQEVKNTNKKFQFKQGLDERLLTEEKIHELVSWKYDNDYIFAFDNIEDKELIENKLKMIFNLYPNFKKRMKFYVFCGFDRNNIYDENFWKQDIIDVFERCFILSKYLALPYIMRHENAYNSPYSGMYSTISSWANQPSLFKKFDFKTFSKCRGMGNFYNIYKRDTEKYLKEIGKKGACWKYMEEFESKYPEISNKYFNIVPDSLVKIRKIK